MFHDFFGNLMLIVLVVILRAEFAMSAYGPFTTIEDLEAKRRDEKAYWAFMREENEWQELENERIWEEQQEAESEDVVYEISHHALALNGCYCFYQDIDGIWYQDQHELEHLETELNATTIVNWNDESAPSLIIICKKSDDRVSTVLSAPSPYDSIEEY